MIAVNAQVKSSGVAVKVLKKLTSISICQSHLNELTGTIGEELSAQRDQQAASHEQGKLKPEVAGPPEVVAVGTDGGRIFTREEGCGRGVHEPAWKETKVACLMTLSSQTYEDDPHPDLPGCFAESERVGKLVRELKSIRGMCSHDGSGDASAEETSVTAAPDLLEFLVLPPEREVGGSSDTIAESSSPPKGKKRDWRPRRRVRTSVVSMCSSDEFGVKVAAEAQRRNFCAAKRRAFLGDGLPWNWTIWKRWFADFVPILDFVHPMTYVYEASRAMMADASRGWELCRRWLEAIWQGRVSLVLAALHDWQSHHPVPPDAKLPDSDPRSIVSKATTYLTNNMSRMDYPRYRREGLPVTSAMVESLIKELNYRVKGTEKSWNREGGTEPILQVVNAVLCDDRDRLGEFILSRPGSAYYRRTTAKRASEQSLAT